MNGKITIKELLELEKELNSATAPPLERDAKVNMLKYLQIDTVHQYGAACDGLVYELNKEGGLERLRNIKPVESKIDFLQPKVYDLQGCEGPEKLERLVDLYLADAEVAKQCLDDIIRTVVENLEGCEAQYAEVKLRERTVDKAKKSYKGEVRRVSDMARVTVVCETPELLEQVYLGIMGHLQPQDVLWVGNGFESDWMPGGYRDVKVNPIINEHLCEIQLQLRAFFSLKAGQHAVYRWTRELNVTTEMKAEHLFQNLSGEVMREMIRLAQTDWRGTEHLLPNLYLTAGDYIQAQKGLNKELSEAEDKVLGLEENSKEWRRALLADATARVNLAHSLVKQGKYTEAGPLLLRSSAIEEKTLGPEHPQMASSLNNLAVLWKSQAIP